ncbi:MAG: MXAN_5187 C-terminal domain-containing protein [Pelovirga sp.]
MDERRKLAQELDILQNQLKELEIRYEQYFAGSERREPLPIRTSFEKNIRHFTNRHIVWTDLKFRYQGIATRFMSYCQYWDRIQRLMDEGKYHRHTTRQPLSPPSPAPAAAEPSAIVAERLQQMMLQARKDCGLHGAGPSTEAIASFLDAQKEQIRSRYGDRPVEFCVDTEGGKPRIKVRPKN